MVCIHRGSEQAVARFTDTRSAFSRLCLAPLRSTCASACQCFNFGTAGRGRSSCRSGSHGTSPLSVPPPVPELQVPPWPGPGGGDRGVLALVLSIQSDGLGGKGCTRMRPEVAPARSWARYPSHWLHGIVRNLEGCAVPHRSIRA
jgi:hypothetical protein